MKVRLVPALAAAAALAVLSGCTGATEPTPTPTPSATATATQEVAPQGVVVKDASLVVSGKDATLKATIANEGAQTVTLRAVSCPCAGMVQLGTKSGNSVSPLSTGVPVEPGKTAALGGDVVVKLTGVTSDVKPGSEATLQAYFGTAGTVEFVAKVVKG